MSKFWSFAALIVGGIIVADMIANSDGTAQVLTGVTGLEGNVGNQLLGSPVAATTSSTKKS